MHIGRHKHRAAATVVEVVVSVLIVAAVLALSGAMLWNVWAPARHMQQTAVSMIGRPASDLIRALGPPRHIVRKSTLAGRTVDYPWKGWNFVPAPTRAVRNKVLLYSEFNVAVYVYIDGNGMIEAVVSAGT